MLTLEERQKVAKSTSYFFSIFLIPARFDVNTWQFYPGCATKYKNWACKISYALFIVHTLYKVLRLIGGFPFLQNTTPLHHAIIHFAVATATPIFVGWYYLLFIKYPDAYLLIMNMSLSDSFGQGKIRWK